MRYTFDGYDAIVNSDEEIVFDGIPERAAGFLVEYMNLYESTRDRLKKEIEINEKLLAACEMALAEMQNTDSYLESQAEREGKLGIYNPFFAKEIRTLKAAIAKAKGGKMTEQTNEQRYTKCAKCGAEAVHLAMSGGIAFFGDQDDDLGDESEYADEIIEPGDNDVRVGVHVCFACKEIEDVFIEHPRDLDLDNSPNGTSPRTSDVELLGGGDSGKG